MKSTADIKSQIKDAPNLKRPGNTINKFIRLSVIACTLLVHPYSLGADNKNHSNHNMQQKHDHHNIAGMDHSQHRNMLKKKGQYKTSIHKYDLPDISLTGTEGNNVRLQQLLNDPNPVLVNFIFTTCTTICPAMSVIFSGVHTRLAAMDSQARMISISIDPEYDTPERLKSYASNFEADKNWLFFTGKLASIVELQKKLDVYRGNKMNHFPVTFIRNNPSSEWLRIEGFASADSIIKEYHLLGKQ